MAENLTNCIRCKRLFKKTVSDKCPSCAAREQDQFSDVFRILQASRANGGIHIGELSREVGMPESVLEEYYIEGKLGTASAFLNFSCKKCGAEYSGKEGHGSICISCRAHVSSEAGVEIRSRGAVKDDHKEQSRMDLLSKLKSAPPPARNNPSSGFKRTSD